MKRILLVLAILFSTLGANAQGVGIVGSSLGSWDNDVFMQSTDDVNWTLENQVFGTGAIKFRLNGSWTTNWGGSSFPSGTAVQNGPDIVVTPGVYNVAFNSTTGAYTFTPAVTFPSIGVIGTAVSANGFSGPDVDMVTTDGITYTLYAYGFSAGELKFRQDDSWTSNWGGDGFPSGTAVLNGNNIVVPAGYYTVTLNIQTGAYSFTFPSVGVIGTALPNGFDGPDVDMTTYNGETYVLYNYTFTAGEAKFRQDDSWTVNWGAADFPFGTGTQGGANIPVTAGNYTVNFNRVTGAYSFDTPIIYDNVGLIGTAVTANGFDGPDVDLTTVDGITYTLDNYTFTNGEAKFRLNDAWVNSWGAASFPAGIGQDPGVNIPVVAGTYSVTFNRATGAYSFDGTPTFPTVGILGPAVNGWDVADTNLTTNDGITYTLLNFTYQSGEAKIRLNDAWATSWGSNSFPAGGNDGTNIVIPAGTYDLSFNIQTGEYSFSATGTWPLIGILGTAVDANGFDGPDTDLTTTNGIIYTLTDWTFTAGEAKFRYDDAWDFNYGGVFPSGSAVAGGDNIPVPAGVYTVTFNRATMTYNFAGQGFAAIGILGDAVPGAPFTGPDLDLVTTDGVNYSIDGLDLVTGFCKFRENNAWDVNWGGPNFPSGVATQGGSDIPVATNRYNIDFNRTTGEYNFGFVSIGIIGNAVGSWDNDVVTMTTTDGVNYSATAVPLVAGELKFRENGKWTVNWGSVDFPTGTGTQDGANIVATEGTYDVTFNRLTGAYTFVFLGVEDFGGRSFAVYPNPSNTSWTFNGGGRRIDSVIITDMTGKIVRQQNANTDAVTVDASALPAGFYLARIVGENATATLKVVRN